MDAGSNIDYSQLPPELLKKMQQWEANKPENKQLRTLTDIASMVHELINLADTGKAENVRQIKALGAVLTDSRQQLIALNKKEVSIPDFDPKPIVEAVRSLESVIGGLELKPTLNPTFTPNINVAAPEVKVPDVKVDLKEVSRILKTDIPAAFDKSIANIPETPETDLSPLTDRLDTALERLKDIDTGVRMKPQPGTMRVTNTDNTVIGGGKLFTLPFDEVDKTNPDAVTSVLVSKAAGVTQQTATITYTDSTKADWVSIVRT